MKIKDKLQKILSQQKDYLKICPMKLEKVNNNNKIMKNLLVIDLKD